MLTGTVERLAIAPLADAPVRLVPRDRVLSGHGLGGDRYAEGSGTFSPRSAHRLGDELTLITRGIRIDALVGRDFFIRDVHCRGLRLAEPCAHLERLHGPGLLRPLIHCGGVRADILSDGIISEGSPISTEPARTEDGSS